MKAPLAAAVFLWSAHANATTVVAIWTPTRIVISADSLINSTWTGSDGRSRQNLSNACKIRKFGANYVSAAGNYHIQSAGFDLWETSARACGGSANVELCAVRLKSELRSVLQRTAGIHEVHLTLLVAGRQNGSPALEHMTFVSTRYGRLNEQFESFRRGAGTWGRVILGDREAIDRYEQGASPMTNISLQDQTQTLVRIEAWARPQEVGPPFSTLTIDASGDHWVAPGICLANRPK